MKRFLTIKEYSLAANVSRQAVYDMIKDGYIIPKREITLSGKIQRSIDRQEYPPGNFKKFRKQNKKSLKNA